MNYINFTLLIVNFQVMEETEDDDEMPPLMEDDGDSSARAGRRSYILGHFSRRRFLDCIL